MQVSHIMLYIFFFYSKNSQLLDIMLHNHNPECAHCAEHENEHVGSCDRKNNSVSRFRCRYRDYYKQLFLAAQNCSSPNKTWSYWNTISFLIRIQLT